MRSTQSTRRTKQFLVGSGLAAAAVLGATAIPAFAVGDTTTTFTLAGNGLSISVPGSANLSTSGSTLIGATSLSGSLGAVTVTDNQGTLAHTWTATVSSTDFTTGGGGSNKTITKDNASYTPGTVSTSGVGVAVGTPASSLATSSSVVTATAVIGSMTATWNPTVSVTIPTSVIAGTYSGTITHSVS
jgi:hypothetical protein